MNTPNNALEQLMDEAYADNTRLGEFYAALLSSDLFILTEGDTQIEGRKKLDADTKIGVVNFVMEDGTAFVPVFTSVEEMQRSVNEDHSYLGLNGWSLFSMNQGTEIVINPASDKALRLDAPYIKQLLQYFGAQEVPVNKDTPILMGQPAEDPLKLKKSIADVFEKEGSIDSAYLALIFNQETNEHSILIGVIYHEGQENADVINVAGVAAQEFIPEGYALDFIVIHEEFADGVSGALKQKENLFYQSKK
jgi:hypothetical protein